MLITYIYFFNKRGGEAWEGEILMIADVNLFIRDNLVGLIKERSELKFIIDCIYKFKIFKLSSILFFYIY